MNSPPTIHHVSLCFAMAVVLPPFSGCTKPPDQLGLSTTELVETWERHSVPSKTPQCVGEVVRIEGKQGHNPLYRDSWDMGTTFDLRGTSWESVLLPPPESENCYPIQLGADWGGCLPSRIDLYSGQVPLPDLGPPVCVVGGALIGTQPTSASWAEVKGSAAMAVTANARQPVVEGMRIHNHEDGFVPFRSEGFVFQGNWISYNRDDCIENDAFASGLIRDNLFDGCYVFYSATNAAENPPTAIGGGPDSVVTMRGNLVRLEVMPGPYRSPSDTTGYGWYFKTWGGNAPVTVLEENIFLAEPPIATGNPRLDAGTIDRKRCRDNVIVWTGNGSFPYPFHEDCFVVTTDLAVWDKARRRWLDRHPEVTRLGTDE